MSAAGRDRPGAFMAMYRAVLRVCPRDFRTRYGVDLIRTVEARDDDGAQLGFLPRQRQRRRELFALILSAYGLRVPGRRNATRSPRRTRLMDGLGADIRHAFRRLAKTPAFTSIAILTLALGVGASTAIFSLVNGILLEPLPYPEPDRLVAIWNEASGVGIDQFELSDAVYYTYRVGSTSFDSVAISQEQERILTGDGEPVRLRSAAVTPSLFAVLQVQPELGRAFTEDEGAVGGGAVVMISNGLWSSRFGADPDILGRRIEVSGVARLIVGVMPATFRYPEPATKLWTPLVVDPQQLVGQAFRYAGVGRLRAGITQDDARIEMAAVLPQLVAHDPISFSAAGFERWGLGPILTTLKEDVVGDISELLFVLMGTAGFVLMIACANVANLLLVRAEGNLREVAVRTALGAGRGRIMRFYVTESAVLGVMGMALGLVLAWASIRVVVAFDPGTLPRLAEVSINSRALVFALVASLASSLAFAALPAARLRLTALVAPLRDGGRSSTSGRSRNRVRNTLVAAQVALALVLLIGSGLMLRSFSALRHVDPGFDAADAISMDISLPALEYPDGPDITRFALEITERVAGMPGVTAAGTTSRMGLTGGGDMTGISVENFPMPENGDSLVHPVRIVSPDFFAAMAIPLIAGRVLDRNDSLTGARAAVVSKAFADRFWPDAPALGNRLKIAGEPDWHTVVGVVGSIRDRDLRRESGQTIYLPLQGHGYLRRSMTLVVRTVNDPTALVPTLREQVWAIDDGLAISGVATLERLVADSMAHTTFAMSMLTIAGVVSLLLGTIGIYGVVSYVVSRRTAEIGVRMALGARAGEVLAMVLAQGMTVVAAGVVVGLVAATALMRVMESLLFGVSPLDPITFVAVPVVLGAAAAAACLLPARRAASVDPGVALRD